MDVAGERRIVTVLVSDVVDSTAIAERLGPERSKFLFDEIVGLMAEQVRSFDGTVAQLTGDGVLALFGAPVSHGDDAERAVRAALAMREALGAYAAELESAYDIELTARVAVNTGPVVVPVTDAPPDVLYNALGDTVNVAARLQSFAGAGGIAAGPATARELAGRFRLESLGELELKGKTERVAAFRVVGEAEAEAVRESPLVGREQELTALVDALVGLEDGLGAIVAITGEPGIGKSRLVAEARAWAPGEVRSLVGNAASFSSNAPFWPIRDLLRGWLGVGVADTEGRVRLELKAAVAAALGGNADRAYPFLASLLGLTLQGGDAERLAGLSRDSVQRQTFEAVAMLLAALARERPLCVVFEDLHWADDSTLALLEELLELADREAILIVLLYRSERDHGAWHLGELARKRFPHRLLELELRSLTPGDSRLLAAGAAGADLPTEVAELLAARAGGNPFFLEEALRDLVERGVLHPVNAHWELTIAADELTVPLIVQETLQARLDRLQPGTREVVSVAAVIGVRFGLPLLEQLTDRAGLPAALSELQRVDLVVEERRQPVREFRFRHGLVQEVAYGSLTDARRRGLHRAAGETLESMRSDALEEVYEPLAHHFTEAGVPEKAIDYLLAAADAAWALYADRPALSHYRRALEFMDADDPRCRDLLCKIALAHHLDFDFAAATDAWARAGAGAPRAHTSPRPTEHLIVAAVPDLPRWVPGHSYDTMGWWLTTELFAGLLRLERGLNVTLDTAAQLQVSDDGLRYTARLRPDAVWSDGEPLKPGDFIYAWDQIRVQRLNTALFLDDIAEANALDDRTLEIRLRRPSSYFVYLLALPPLFPWPRHVCEQVGDAWLEPPHSVSNGAFVQTERGEHHERLIANDRWDRDRGNVAEIVVRHVPQHEYPSAWRRGDIDIHYGPRGADVRGREGGPGLTTEFVGFMAGSPPFDDVRVRRAFAHALDRVRITNEREGGEPASHGGFVPAAMPGHSHRIGLDYDPARARKLLADAGFPNARGLPEIVLASPVEEWAAPVAAQWREHLGAQVRIVSYPLVGDPRDADPQVSCWVHGWSADFPDPAGVIAPVITGVSGLASLYRDDETLAVADGFLRATDRDERLRLVQELERTWLGEHVALVPLRYTGQDWWVGPRVHGFWTTPVLPGRMSELNVRR